jgi:Domain of unknown function (DUF4439)
MPRCSARDGGSGRPPSSALRRCARAEGRLVNIPLQQGRAGTATEALRACLAAEHVAVWAYGIVGAHLELEARLEARATWDSHRARRDRIAQLLRDREAPAPASEPGYALPYAVTDATTARRLAGDVESGVAAVYADLVLAAGGELRRFAALSLQEAAVRAARWSGSAPAFPGITER